MENSELLHSLIGSEVNRQKAIGAKYLQYIEPDEYVRYVATPNGNNRDVGFKPMGKFHPVTQTLYVLGIAFAQTSV